MRLIGLFATAALFSSVLASGTAASAATPPTGLLVCDMTGVATFGRPVPPLSAPPAAKATPMKIKNAVGDPCDSDDVSGGRAPITDAVVRLSAKIPPGAQCPALLGDPGPLDARLSVKLRHTDEATGRTTMVATVKVVDVRFTYQGPGWNITADIAQSAAGNRPFGGHLFWMQLNIDNLWDLSPCVHGNESLDHIEFNASSESNFKIIP